MARAYRYANFIGRIQGFHHSQKRVLDHALDIAEEVNVILGSHRQAPDVRNTWTCDERQEHIRSAYDHTTNKRLNFIYAKDFLYNNTYWRNQLAAQVQVATGGCDNICLVGHKKDSTSFYLDYFPEWSFESVPRFAQLSSTYIRNSLFGGDDEWKGSIVPSVIPYLEKFKTTDRYENLVGEFKWLKDYKGNNVTAKDGYPVVHVTADAVVFTSGHVLLVRRGRYPGKGLLALPGGHCEGQERIVAAIRELSEETKISYRYKGQTIPYDKQELAGKIVGDAEFDHPRRSLRGHVNTRAFCLRFPDTGEIPIVQGGDDAAEALWIPHHQLASLEDQFFEDHLHIIEYFWFRYAAGNQYDFGGLS